ncbi:MAG: hypothetical protein ACPL6C_01540, partial [bacterium]
MVSTKEKAYILVFLLGTLSIFSQAFLFRELTTTLRANELILSLLLFNWFLGTSLGASFGLPLKSLTLKFVIYVILISLNPFLLKFYTILTQKSPGAFIELHILMLITILLLFPFCYLSGSIFLDISKAFIKLGGKPGKFYAADALGGFLGGCLTYLVIAKLDSAIILSIAGMCGLLAIIIFERKP